MLMQNINDAMVSHQVFYWLIAVAALCGAIVFALRAKNGVSDPRVSPAGVIRRRILCGVLAAVAVMQVALPAALPAIMARSSDLEDAAMLAAGDELPAASPIPAIATLTERQIQAFLDENNYSLKLDDSSLASQLEDRIPEYEKAGMTDFSDGIGRPYEDALIAIETFKSLSDEAKASYFEKWRHQIEQDVIANPVIGIAWLEALNEVPIITENNPWIAENLAVLKEFFAGTYKAPQKTDKDYTEKTKVELRNIPDHSSATARGLDYLVDTSKVTPEVRMEWARVAVRMCYVLRYFKIAGITNRTSVANWHMPPIAEDSMCRAAKAEKQESKSAILLVYYDKEGRESVALGSNLFDRRPEIFGTNVKEPTKTYTPPKKEETPPATTTPEPNPTPQKTTPVTYRTTFECKDFDTNKLLTPSDGSKSTWTVTTKNYGETQWVYAPPVAGYGLYDPVDGKMLVDISANNGATKTFWYRKVQKTVEGEVTVIYIDDATEARMDGMAPKRETGKVDEPFNIRSYAAPDGWRLKNSSQSVVSGKFTREPQTIYVRYVRLEQTCTVNVSYVYEDGGTVYGPKSYTLKLGEKYDEDGIDAPRNYWFSPDAGYHGVITQADVDRGYLNLVFTYHYKPLPNWKDPAVDPVNKDNADEGGGDNLPDDGPGEEEPVKTPEEDYPDEGTYYPGSNPDRNDIDPDTGNSTEVLPAGNDQKHESSGQGKDDDGYQLPDHEIKDPNGGLTDNGKPAEKDPLPVNPGTTLTDDNTGKVTSAPTENITGSLAVPD